MDEQAFVGLLEHVLTPDTNLVKQATSTLRSEYFTKPQALPVLIHLLSTHPNEKLRQLAAVEARSLVPKFWGVKNNAPSKIPGEMKPQIRETLLRTTVDEPNSLVKHSSARVISAIAKIDLPAGEWLDLPNFLSQAATSSNATDREVGIYIFYTLLESLEDTISDRWRDFLELFGRTINDPESTAVRVNTLLALGKLAEFLNVDEHEEGVKVFRELLPPMVSVLKEVINAGDEEKANAAFEVFQTLLIVEPALTANHFRDLVEFFSDLSVDKNLDDDFRDKALSFLMSCLRYRKMKMQALRAGEQLTLRAMEIVTEFKDDDDDVDDQTPSKTALSLLDYLASSLPPSQVVVPLLNALPQYTNNHDPDYRRAGVLALGYCVEGAPDFIVTQLGAIFPVVLQLLNDPEAKVRQAALQAVTRLADDCAEDLGREHARLIPVLINMMSSGDGPEIWRPACNAIDAVLVGIEQEDVQVYLPTLMPKLMEMFQGKELKLKASAVGGIGSAAIAAQDSFTPYFNDVMAALTPCVSIKDSEDELDLRGVVMDCMSNIADAVGMDSFTPYVEPLMRSAEESLNLGHPRLRETAFYFFGTIAKIYKEDFRPFLDGVTTALFQSLEQSETDVEPGELAITSVGAPGAEHATISGAVAVDMDGEEDWDDEEDGLDDGMWTEMAVNAVSIEKEVAAEVLGDILSNCKQSYLPYLERTVELLAAKAQHPYEGVRKMSVSTLWRAYASLWKVSEDNGMAKWQPGLPLKIQPTPELQKLGQLVITCTLTNLANEADRNAVTDICRNLGETLKLCGPAILQSSELGIILELTTQIHLILDKKHPSQLDVDDEEMPDLQESSEYDWLLIDTAMDVLLGLAMALGPNFSEVWKVTGHLLLKYASSTEPVERSTSVGVIADSIKYMESSCTEYTEQMMSMLLRRLGDEDSETKSNASYAIGMLCLHSQASDLTIREYPRILERLESMLQNPSSRMQDNAAGCIARMIMAHPENVNLPDILPALISTLPLKEDFEENEPIYRMLVQLYKNSNQTVFSMTQQLVPIFAFVLGEPRHQLDPETQGQLVELIRFIGGKEPAVLQGHNNLLALLQ